MNRILLLLEHKENCRLLSAWLKEHYEVLSGNGWQASQLLVPFDLCILDGSALVQLREPIQAIREAQQPVFLPFMLITSRQGVQMMGNGLEDLVDELIISPVETGELSTRIKMLLRSRSYSLQLKSTNEKLCCETTELLGAQEALRESELQFRQLAENINEVFWIKSVDQNQTLYISPIYETLYGRSRQSLYADSYSWLDLVIPEDRERLFKSLEAEKQGQLTSQEFRILRPDGEIHWLWRRAFPVRNEQGKFYRIAGIVEDITKRKQAELKIQKMLTAEKELNQLRSRFVSMVSHEFRNPLNSISGLAQMLQRYSDKLADERKQEMLEHIQGGVQKMLALLEDVLVIGQAGAGKFQFNPALLELASFCQDLVRETKFNLDGKHEINLLYQGNSTAVVDEKLLRHILVNLLSNAIKYSPRGSTINLEVNCQSKEVTFHIQDQGIGIPPEEQQRLFEAFHRATNVGEIPGTGLGLAIVKQCVELHDGAIAVDSEIGTGTTFTVSIPLPTFPVEG